MIFSFAMFKIPGEKQFCVIISDNFKSTEWLWKTVFLFILLKKISIYKQVKLVLETLPRFFNKSLLSFSFLFYFTSSNFELHTEWFLFLFFSHWFSYPQISKILSLQ